MAPLFSMAFRNLLRNKRRTTITIVGISMGLALCQTVYNLNLGNYNSMLDKGIRGASGHVVVQHAQWLEDPEVGHVVEDSTAIRDRLQTDNPDALVIRRIMAGGLVTSPTNAVSAAILGVDPGPESELSRAASRMLEGEWLKPDDRRGLVLGDTLAKRLGVVVMTVNVRSVSGSAWPSSRPGNSGSVTCSGAVHVSQSPARQNKSPSCIV